MAADLPTLIAACRAELERLELERKRVELVLAALEGAGNNAQAPARKARRGERQIAAIAHVRARPGVTNRELAEHLGITPAHARNTVDRLLKQGGHIKRERGRLYPVAGGL
jgi:predicted HTH transcriptional regulator